MKRMIVPLQHGAPHIGKGYVLHNDNPMIGLSLEKGKGLFLITSHCAHIFIF